MGGSLGSILKGEEVEKKEGSSFKQRLVSSPWGLAKVVRVWVGVVGGSQVCGPLQKKGLPMKMISEQIDNLY